MAGTGTFRRSSRPQRDAMRGNAQTWERSRYDELDEYPVDISDHEAIQGGEICDSVTSVDRAGVTVDSIAVTGAGKVTVRLSKGGDGWLTARVVTHKLPVTLEDCYAILNDLKTKYEAHRVDTTYHAVANTTDAIAAAAATTFATAVTLADELKQDFNLHRTDNSEASHQIDDDTNVVTATSTPTTLANLKTLVNDIRAKYLAHLNDLTGGYHAAAPDTDNLPAAYDGRIIPIPMQWVANWSSQVDPYQRRGSGSR